MARRRRRSRERGRRLVDAMAGLQLPNPPPTQPAVRNVMRANAPATPARNGASAEALREAGLGGYRLNWKQSARPAGHRLPGPQGRDLRPRLLLAPLPALLPEPPEVEPGVLGPQVRTQPRARRPQAHGPRGSGLDRDRERGNATSAKRLELADSRMCNQLSALSRSSWNACAEYRRELVTVKSIRLCDSSHLLVATTDCGPVVQVRSRRPRSAAGGRCPCTAGAGSPAR